MANFNAKQLFTCENPDMVRSRMVIATMQVMQAKVRVHYTLLMNTKLIWTSRIPTAATDGYYVYVNVLSLVAERQSTRFSLCS